MKYILLLFTLCINIVVFSQEKKIHIVNNDHKEIPYVNVVVDEKEGIGFISNSNGMVNIDIKDFAKYANKNIEISCIGYQSIVISYNEFISKDTIILNEATLQIPEISVVYKKHKSKYIGNHRIKGYPGYYHCKQGSEVASFIKPDINTSHIFKNIQVYISNRGVPNSDFRIIIYFATNDSIPKPGSIIFNKNLIGNSIKGNEWVSFDILKYNIKIPTNGFFVSVLWLYNAKGYTKTIKNKLQKNIEYNLYGQVLKAKCPEDSLYINYVWSRNFLFKKEWVNDKNLMIPIIKCEIIKDNL